MGFQMTGQFILLVATVGHLRVPTSASIITLTKDPPTIKPLLTTQLSVRCDLNDTQTGSTLVGKRDGVVQTSTNIKQLISLVVLRNGVDLATVTGYTPASGAPKLNQGTLNVTGDITGSTGYLELNWTYPGEEESGNLTCEANGIDANGHTTQYMASVVVGVQQPSLSDLVSHVHRQEVLLVQQTGQLTQQAGQIAQQNNQISQLTSKLDDQSSKLSQQAGLISAQAKEISDQRQQISHLSNMTDHVEVGEVDCGDSNTWTEKPYYSINKPVTFKDRYGAPPMVMLSATFVDKVTATDYNVPIYELFALSVTEAGFTLRCKSQGGRSLNHYRWEKLKVTWAAFPQYRP